MEDRLRLEYATEVFLAEARRQFAQMNPGKPCPIRRMEGYSPEHRSALMAAVGRALDSTDPKANLSYMNWKLSREGKSQ